MPDNSFDFEAFARTYGNFASHPLTEGTYEAFGVKELTENLAERIAATIINSERFQKMMVVGHGGCGKSTIFNRLLRDEALNEKYHVMAFSLLDMLNFMDAEATDVLFAIYVKLFHAMGDKGLEPPLKEMETLIGPVARDFGIDDQGGDLLRTVSFRIRVDAGFREAMRRKWKTDSDALQAGVNGLCEKFSKNTYDCFKLTGEVLEKLRQEDVSENMLSKLVELKDREFKSELRFVRTLKQQIGDIQALHYEPVILKHARVEIPRDALILIDDSDKLKRGLAEKIFFEGGHLLTLPRAKILLAFPLSVYYSPLFFQIRDRFACEFVRPVQLYDMSGTLQEKALALLREVAEKRMVGPIVSEEALNYLICHSGGSLRDLMHLLRDACKIAMVRQIPALDESVARASVRRFSDLYKRFFEVSEYKEMVRKIRDVKSKAGMSNKDLIYLLRYRFVLEYENPGEPAWYDAHPCLVS